MSQLQLTSRKTAKWPLIATIVSVIGILGGLYLILLTTAPALPSSSNIIEKKLTKPPAKENQLYIPKIGVNVPFLEGSAAVLEKGAWHRYPERGNPEMGGNFILSAHRFRMRPTPEETRKSSAFYYINKVGVGDDIIIDYKQKRYVYEVTKKFAVKPTHVEIEEPSPGEAKLTLYSCTLLGSNDGREVLIAKLDTTPHQ